MLLFLLSIKTKVRVLLNNVCTKRVSKGKMLQWKSLKTIVVNFLKFSLKIEKNIKKTSFIINIKLDVIHVLKDVMTWVWNMHLPNRVNRVISISSRKENEISIKNLILLWMEGGAKVIKTR